MARFGVTLIYGRYCTMRAKEKREPLTAHTDEDHSYLLEPADCGLMVVAASADGGRLLLLEWCRI